MSFKIDTKAVDHHWVVINMLRTELRSATNETDRKALEEALVYFARQCNDLQLGPAE